ncbi:uncharacterized protein LOC126054377 [Helicoverpa armigera]|uniref:uncharacterized protein LOC126054377 n=1 Tax=Helicoverpa armigera TaxID=29058 RepID=UPI003083565A
MKFLQVVLLALAALVASVAGAIPNIQNPVVNMRDADPNFITVPPNCPPGQVMGPDGVCREPCYDMKFLQVVLLALAALVASVAAGISAIPNVQNPVVVGRISVPYNCPPGEEMSVDKVCREPW